MNSVHCTNISGDVQPPSAPWSALSVKTPPLGYLSFYYSDALSALPVRDITRPRDNKSDPNIETGTYGLFSTCERKMRAGIVGGGYQYIIFVCRKSGRRVVAGYYRLAWKTEGVLHAKMDDYALAADVVHFVDPPIPIEDLPEPALSAVNTGFRLYKKTNRAQTEALVSELDARPNSLANYLSEVDRLERFQFHHSGFRYLTWLQEESFSWRIANRYLTQPSDIQSAPNQSTTGFWRCASFDCRKFVMNQSLLKGCPYCKRMGTLQPVNEAELELEGV